MSALLALHKKISTKSDNLKCGIDAKNSYLRLLFECKATLQRHTENCSRVAACHVCDVNREASDLCDLIAGLEEERRQNLQEEHDEQARRETACTAQEARRAASEEKASASRLDSSEKKHKER